LDLRLERQIRALLERGIDPRRVDVDWAKLRRAERPAAQREVRVGLLLERIAAEEKIEASEAEIQQKLEQLAGERQVSSEALRARLTKEAGLDSIASGVRSEKVIELLHSHARFAAPSRS
jgi:trigger factor